MAVLQNDFFLKLALNPAKDIWSRPNSARIGDANPKTLAPRVPTMRTTLISCELFQDTRLLVGYLVTRVATAMELSNGNEAIVSIPYLPGNPIFIQ
uniref:Uncharacterized protein n=1 Tax=Ascaris lumbricoides TaxID=6252 RepID=A0A0M3HQF6_ASCLU